MEQRKRAGGSMGVSIGSATLVMLFAVLCLTIFAAMALVTANHEWSLAQKSADAVSAYYEADALAVSVYDHLCAEGTDVLQIEGVSVAQEDNGNLSYEVPVDANRVLSVVLRPSAETRWAVQSWQLVQTGEWQAEDTVEVWNGE